MRGRSDDDGYNNQEACITMHQPWASLLVHGIKRIEGRSWPAPLRGRLWIHAASKVPDSATIKAMEDFYREIYAVDGITDLKFPDNYSVSRLLGCVEVVGCVKCEELVCWEAIPEGVRLEGMTNFCWLCEKPQKLLVPFGMRGNQGVYNLETEIYEATVRGLCRVEGPLPVKFPLPDPRNPLSLKPGSLIPYFTSSKPSKVEKPPSLTAAIADARAAATQYSKKGVKHQPNTVQERRAFDSSSRQCLDDKFTEEYRKSTATLQQRPQERVSVHNFKEQNTYVNPSSLTAATTGAHVAATQYSKKEVKHNPNTVQERRAFDSSSRQYLDDKFTDEYRKSTATLLQRPQERDSVHNFKEHNTYVNPPSLTAGARVAATQYSNKEVKHKKNTVQETQTFDSSSRQHSKNRFTEDRKSTATIQQRPQERDSVHNYEEQNSHVKCERSSTSGNQDPRQDLNHRHGAPSKIFAAALKGLRPA